MEIEQSHRTLAGSIDKTVNKNPNYLNIVLYESIKPTLSSWPGF